MALAAAFAITVLATPAGISGAVLLLPFQVSVLCTPSPAVTPANLPGNVARGRPATWLRWACQVIHDVGHGGFRAG